MDAATASGPLVSALALDLYELTMAQSYLDEEMEADATFSLFVRDLPTERGYLVAAGLDDALAYVERLAFTSDDVAFLESTRLFTKRLLDRLAAFQFTGSVRAMPEGTICFAGEPLLEVTAPILEAQLVETVLINEMQLQTMIASKAARCVTAARGRRLVDFSLRRTHGLEAGLKVARASYLAGFDATSNVQAGQQYGLPIAGTMAHSYIQAFSHEIEAFRAYARAYPDSAVLLVDTYDSVEGARLAAKVGMDLAITGHRLTGIRLDSGDPIALSRVARHVLNDAGLASTTIFASGSLDEHAIEAILAAEAPIDGFGVGTRLGVSADEPHLDMVYKLVEYGGRPTRKLSTGKVTWPGGKQVWRARHGCDWLGLAGEEMPDGSEPLLVPVMARGQRFSPPEPLDRVRERCRQGLAALPPGCLRLRDPDRYPVQPTDGLFALERATAASLQQAG